MESLAFYAICKKNLIPCSVSGVIIGAVLTYSTDSAEVLNAWRAEQPTVRKLTYRTFCDKRTPRNRPVSQNRYIMSSIGPAEGRLSSHPRNIAPEYTVSPVMGGSGFWYRRFRSFLGRLHEEHREALRECRRIRLTARPPSPSAVPFLVFIASLRDSELIDRTERENVRWARRALLCPLAKARPRQGVGSAHG